MFEENKHPRDKNGQFANKNSTEKQRNAVKKYSDSPAEDMAAMGISPNLSELLGKEFTGIKGQNAIKKLLQEKQGHIKGAFHRDDIGDIDLIWGNDSFGLKHIIKNRQAQGIDINDFMNDLTDVIERGTLKKQNQRGDYQFLHKGKMAVVAKEFKNNKITYLLTAFKTRYKK